MRKLCSCAVTVTAVTVTGVCAATTPRVVCAHRGRGRAGCIRYASGSVWVGSKTGNDVFRIDPATNRARPVRIGAGGSTCLDASFGSIWVDGDLNGAVYRVDPATNAVVATIAVGQGPADATAGPDGLEWIPNLLDGTISRIDPDTNAVVDTIRTVARPFVVRSAFGDVWSGDFARTKVWRFHVTA